MSEGLYNPHHYFPNHTGNLISAIAFGIVLVWNIVSSIYYKQWWFGTTFFIASALETIGYIGRVLASDDVYNMNYYIWQIICLTMAPSFYMAGIYYLLANFSVIYGNGISRLKPMWYSYIFITCDLISICIQGAGGAISAVSTTNPDAVKTGTNVLIAGLVIQLIAIAVFGGFCLDFYLMVQKRKKQAFEQNPELYRLTREEIDSTIFEPRYAFVRNKRPLFKVFILSVLACTTLIFIRSVFRTIEFAVPEDSVLRTKEVYMFVFDTIPVFIGVALMVYVHPGRVFGKDVKIDVKSKSFKLPKNYDDLSYSTSNVELLRR